MKEVQGYPLPLGVKIYNDKINFSIAAPAGKACRLLIYRRGRKHPCQQFEMRQTVGEVRCLALEDIDPEKYEYNYMIGDEIMVDPYAQALAGRERWGVKKDVQEHEVRGRFVDQSYDWEGDRPLQLTYHEVVAYSLHVRGYTRHSSSKVKAKGTFQGMQEKLPYLKDLGINQVHCMPVYEFDECNRYGNYWGYGDGYFFAPKSAYAADGDGAKSLKDMVKAYHKAGIEIVLEMPFVQGTDKMMMLECLRHYVMEYHIDGFILNPLIAPMESVQADPVLKCTKIMEHQLGFQTVMRRFLKGDEGMVHDVIYWLKHHSEKEGIFNYIADQTGFTLNDLVSYDAKHNEENGENNQDGPDYNFSWNCGAEGPSRKRAVTELRKHQIRNAFFLVLLAQGTPCILAGDEFGNTQKGNNNVYCQDNPTGWTDWRGLEKKKDLYEFVKKLIAFRKNHPILTPEQEVQGIDLSCCGVPDVSYHGEEAWQVPGEVSSRQLGVYYSGAQTKSADCYVAYNMHWLTHTFALPALPKGYGWYVKATTQDGIMNEPKLLKNQRKVELKERTVAVLTADRIVEAKVKKNESNTTSKDHKSS